MEVQYILCVVCLLFVCCYSEQTDISVTTKVGTFTGFKKDVDINGKTVQISKFLGIPYAEPPVGDLRLRKPVPKARLNEPLATKQYGAECIQVQFFPTTGSVSEDCLFLNVYAPTEGTKDDKLAVMVWIYGGGFFMGSANIYVADKIAATGPVIVVTFNYRVSALGFLNPGGRSSSGNYGLWDQHLAIKWVHENIAAFGGDAERVTIFGESAGSGSVIYQGLYPGNKGLFQRIIGESGSAACPWANTAYAKEEAKEFATLVGCETENTQEMMDCFRGISAETINATLNDFENGLFRNPFPFLPSLDNEFVTALPKDILNMDLNIGEKERETFASFDLLTGVNNAEGGGSVHPLCGVQDDPDLFLPNKTLFEETLVPIFIESIVGKDTPKIIKDVVLAEYTDWNDPENPLVIRDQFVAMYGDANFVAPMQLTIDAHSNNSEKSLYIYLFTAVPSQHLIPTPKWLNKANHADELAYVFGGRKDLFESWNVTEDLLSWEKELSQRIMTLWTNFAQTGNPNEPRDVGVDWQPYTKTSHKYLEISREMNPSSVKERIDERRSNLWNKLIPSISKAVLYNKESINEGTCEKEIGCAP